jgi:predicted transcriptional regulator
LSHERVLEALVRLGLSNDDAEVYIYLAKEGPHEKQNMAKALKMYKAQLSWSLNRLQTKGVVSAAKDQATLFSALPFDKVLDLLLKVHLEETRNVEQDKTEILSQWKTLTERDSAL